MALDLSNSADFAKATLSQASSILSDLTGRDGEWDIQEGSYNGVLFHIFESKEAYNGAVSQISDQGGRRKTKFKFPYKDGQTTDDLGRAPESFEFDILLFGRNYMKGFEKLKKELDQPNPGDLIHPVRGSIQVVPESWTITHSSDTRRALAIRLTFIEHNFTIGEFGLSLDPSFKSALTQAIEAFAAIEAAILKIEGTVTFLRELKNKVKALLEGYKNGYAEKLIKLNQTFNDGGSTDIPLLLPTNQGGTGTDEGTTFQTVSSPNDPFANIPDSLLSQVTLTALAVAALQKEVDQLRKDIEAIIALIEGGGGGQGALEFYDDILALKRGAILMQDALEKGIASSNSKIVEYEVPRLMTLREVAFENGLSPDRVGELDVLNPALLSTNYIPQGSILLVPSS